MKKLRCSIGFHPWHVRLIGMPGHAFEVRNCAHYCGKKPEYRYNGKWIEYEYTEKYRPTIVPERMVRP